MVNGFVYGKFFLGQNNIFQLRHIGQKSANPAFQVGFTEGMEDISGVGQALGDVGVDITFKIQVLNTVFFIEQGMKPDYQFNAFPVQVCCVFCLVNDVLNVGFGGGKKISRRFQFVQGQGAENGMGAINVFSADWDIIIDGRGQIRSKRVFIQGFPKHHDFPDKVHD